MSLDPIDDAQQVRQAGAGPLALAMGAQRERTLGLFAALRAARGGRLDIPYSEAVNPPLWELGHVGWFEEFWIARNPERLRGTAARLEAPRAAPLQPGADGLYDSSHVPHARRWHLDLPDAARTLHLLAQGRERSLALLRAGNQSDDALYFFRLALMHEAMHHEADTMIAQALALDVAAAIAATGPVAAAVEGEIQLGATTLTLGTQGSGFAFDNELGAHRVDVAAFTIDRAPVTWGAYLPFIEAGGYDDARYWHPAGWAWRQRELPGGLPRHLSRSDDGRLRCSRFGHWAALEAQQPAVHLSQHETQAWCAWAGRRLPTEAEWICAAEAGADGFAWGQVWEWTASPFAPWPGFAPHPYRDYSQPWFDGRPVLKGGSFATAGFMKHTCYRNFFLPGRNDVFAGFRSCAR